jgi:cobalt transporter subunit CbtA
MALFRRLFLAAVAAGLLAGAAISVVQQFTIVPLILAAEVYEDAAPAEAAGHSHTGAEAAPHGHGHDHGPASGGVDAERLGFTILANLLTGIGYALLLGGAWLVTGTAMNARHGILWGAAGFVAFALAPGFGLPPELPGMAAGEVGPRQVWWISAALCAAGGLWALAFARNGLVIVAALAVAALPHLIGAPHSDTFSEVPPPELAARFTAISLGVTALFWLVLGAASGAMLKRLSPVQG